MCEGQALGGLDCWAIHGMTWSHTTAQIPQAYQALLKREKSHTSRALCPRML